MAAHELRTLVDELSFGEGPRWRDDTLWFSDMHNHRVVRVATDGRTVDSIDTVVEITDDDPSGLGWLPDGRLLVVAMESQQLRRVEADGSVVVHADLSSAARGDLNDMIIRGRRHRVRRRHGRAGAGGGEARPRPNLPGRRRQRECAADDLSSPNGHILTDDGRTLIVAESGASRLTSFTVAADGTLSNWRTC
ncbi:MAG: SMP-30/gluconolactonase/LRE family protein [Acidimicrobiia bacterium]